MSEQTAQQFNVIKTFLKDASLESPNAPGIFRAQGQPEINLNMEHTTNEVEKDMFETVVQLTVTAKLEDKTVYLVEVHQAGLFNISGFPAEHQVLIQNITCPQALYPFAAEAVHSLVIKAGFPPLLLNPIDFEALYRHRQQQDQAKQAESTAS